jgi:rhodanese-related sulfurtransferase
VALYCRSGRRSGIAYDILTKAWYSNVTDAWAITNITGEKITK